MKWLLIISCWLCTSFVTDRVPQIHIIQNKPVENLFTITLDGYRWQELFGGADSGIINKPSYSGDTALTKMMFWANSKEERRAKLMPFFWNIVAKKGSLYGNRSYGNKVNVANIYNFSYPGYNETLTGVADYRTNSNGKKYNANINVLEHLDAQKRFQNKVAVFTSWDVFPYILNTRRNHLFINSGYQQINVAATAGEKTINQIQDKFINEKHLTRFDQLTFITAKEYIQKNKPKVVFFGLGETDDFAHQGRYDKYLLQAKEIDGMIAQLWNYIQTTPRYKNNTTLLITTDHGRGRKESKWDEHGMLVGGSSETWLALIGPNIPALGEVKMRQQIYQKTFAALMARLVGA